MTRRSSGRSSRRRSPKPAPGRSASLDGRGRSGAIATLVGPRRSTPASGACRSSQWRPPTRRPREHAGAASPSRAAAARRLPDPPAGRTRRDPGPRRGPPRRLRALAADRREVRAPARPCPTTGPRTTSSSRRRTARLAAFAMAWWDPDARVGEFEPVGTHPDHQRRGLVAGAPDLGPAPLRRARRPRRPGLLRRLERGSEALYAASASERRAFHRRYERPGRRPTGRRTYNRAHDRSPLRGTRIERDSMGEMAVPADALYGASTQRAVLNFPISGQRVPARVHPRPRAGQAGGRRDERRARPARAGRRAGDRGGGRGGGGRRPRRAVPDRHLPDRLGHLDQHEHERGRRAPRRAAARRRAATSTRTTTSIAARARTT